MMTFSRNKLAYDLAAAAYLSKLLKKRQVSFPA